MVYGPKLMIRLVLLGLLQDGLKLYRMLCARDGLFSRSSGDSSISVSIYLVGCAQKRATQAAAGNVAYSFRSLRNLIAVS